MSPARPQQRGARSSTPSSSAPRRSNPEGVLRDVLVRRASGRAAARSGSRRSGTLLAYGPWLRAAGRADPLGRDRDLGLLERLHGRRRPLRRAGGGARCWTGCERAEPAYLSSLRRASSSRPSCWPRARSTSRELVELALEAIEATQPTLNAFRCVRPEAALAGGRARPTGGWPTGERAPLLGRPGRDQGRHRPGGRDDPVRLRRARSSRRPRTREVVRRLKAAGRGDRRQDERRPSSASGRSPRGRRSASRATPGASTTRPAAPPADRRPPWPPGSCRRRSGRTASGRSAIPAAWTHLVGIKPQRGRVSTWPDAEAFNGLACVGPLARTVADAALLLDAVDRQPPRGPRPARAPPREPFAAAARRADPGRRLRIALSLQDPVRIAAARGSTRRCARQVERLARVARAASATKSSAPIPTTACSAPACCPRSHRRAAAVDRSASPDRSLLDQRTRDSGAAGSAAGRPGARVGARRSSAPMRRQVGAIFRRFDVVLAPTTAQPPLPVGAIDGLSSWETDKVMRRRRARTPGRGTCSAGRGSACPPG